MGYSPWGRKESDTTERLHFISEAIQSPLLPAPRFSGSRQMVRVSSPENCIHSRGAREEGSGSPGPRDTHELRLVSARPGSSGPPPGD